MMDVMPSAGASAPTSSAVSSTSATTLVLDDRERHLSEALTQLGVGHVRRRLDLGDVAIVSGGALKVLVERKSAQDLMASNIDGRYREQRARLASVPEVVLLYVVEEGAQGSLDAPPLRQMITRLLMRYGFPVLITRSVVDTAKWLRVIAGQLAADESVFSRTAPDTSMCSGLSARRCENQTAHGMATGMLASVRGLGARRSKALLRHHSIEAMASLSLQALEALDAGGRRLGPALARRLHDVLRAMGD
jgi:ERCC4-type nuclease